MCVWYIRILNLKISEQMSKSGFFPSRSYIDRDSGFSSKTIINFEECVKNKKIPKDSPSYLKKSSRKSDERVWCWNQTWKVSSWEFCRQICNWWRIWSYAILLFQRKESSQLKDFMRNHRNIVSFIDNS